MEQKDYEKLEKMLCRELKDITDKGELSAGSLETVDKLTHALKNVYKIQMGYEGEYSGDNYPYRRDYSRVSYANDERMRGNYSTRRDYSQAEYDNDSYARGYSRANRGQHYVRGHYSYDDGMDMVESKIMEIINDPSTNSKDKMTLQRALDVLG